MYRIAHVDAMPALPDNGLTMSEHAFLATILAVVVSEVLVLGLVLGGLLYRVYRLSERSEALTAATYLEVRKALSQQR